MTITNLPPGAYCVYAYSFDGNFALSVGTNNYGALTTADNIAGGPIGGVISNNPPPWLSGLHYASWTNVIVAAGQPMVLTVLPGLHDYWAVIGGLQNDSRLATWRSEVMARAELKRLTSDCRSSCREKLARAGLGLRTDWRGALPGNAVGEPAVSPQPSPKQGR